MTRQALISSTGVDVVVDNTVDFIPLLLSVVSKYILYRNSSVLWQ